MKPKLGNIDLRLGLSLGLLVVSVAFPMTPTLKTSEGRTIQHKAELHVRETIESANTGVFPFLRVGAGIGALALAVLARKATHEAEEQFEEQQHQIALRREARREVDMVAHRVSAENEWKQRMAAQTPVALPMAVPVSVAAAQPSAQSGNVASPVMAATAGGGTNGATAAAVRPSLVSPMDLAPPPEVVPDFPREFARNPSSALIVGVPGAGKGLFVYHVANAIREIHPDWIIWGIDAKNEPDEDWRYKKEGLYNRVLRFTGIEYDNFTIIDILERHFEAFQAIKQKGKVLMFDEFSVMAGRLRKDNRKADPKDPMEESISKRYKNLIDKVYSWASCGRSADHHFIGVGQVANADEYGISAGVRDSAFVGIPLLNALKKAPSRGLCKTDFVPSSWHEVEPVLDSSPTGRAIYWPHNDKWYPMPDMRVAGTEEGTAPADSVLPTLPAVTMEMVKEAAAVHGLDYKKLISHLYNVQEGQPGWAEAIAHMKALFSS